MTTADPDLTLRTVRLAEQLIARPSVTPDDAGCQDLLRGLLEPLGFQCEPIDRGGVRNLWAKRPAGRAQTARAATDSIASAPLLVFAGHTDVVPTGPLDAWTSDPFVPTHRDGRLYGRGASDMKSSVAAFAVAVQDFLAATPKPAVAIGLLITSDEEGPATDGTVAVCEALRARGERIDWCIVGEPTSVERTGDMVKNGRRGTLSAKITVHGTQGHIAYPQLADNPIHRALPALAELAATPWDAGNAYFPPTSWQISNIHAGTGATNVIPGTAVVDCNFRFSTASTPEGLQARVEEVLARHGVRHATQWTLGGRPFLTEPGVLLDAVQAAIRAETGIDPALSTTGGTSDGRFIAQLGCEVVEVGPPNATIHQVDEHIVVADIGPLAAIYRGVLQRLDAHARGAA